jgi:hypothetical protein
MNLRVRFSLLYPLATLGKASCTMLGATTPYATRIANNE